MELLTAAFFGSKIKSLAKRGRKFWARVLEAATLEACEAEIASLQKEIEEKEALIQRQYFPFLKQFTPTKLIDADQKPVRQKRYPSRHEIFVRCRIKLDKKVWEFDPEITDFNFGGLFDLQALRGIDGLVHLVDTWKGIFGKDIVCWKGAKGSVVEFAVDSHVYLRKMYPFVWIARIPIERIKARENQIAYLTTLYLDWMNKLAGEHLKSWLFVDQINLSGNKWAYIKSRFEIKDVVVLSARRKSLTNYYLFRQVMFANSGRYIYFVSTGEPRLSPRAPTDYSEHIERWLADFQLGED